MRIDFVTTELNMGGAERCCTELAKFLNARSHRVRIVVLGPRPIPPRDALVHLLESDKIDVHYLGGAGWWMFPSIAWKLRALFKSNPPDLVQSFLWHSNVLSAAVLMGFGIPLVGGMRVAEPIRSRHGWGRWAARRMTHAVCVSESIRQWCIETERVAPEKISVVPNGVTMELEHVPIDPYSHSVPQTARILLFVGRLEAQKGIDVLVDNATSMLQRLPEHHLVILGDGPMRQRVQALSNQAELKGRVHGLGQRNDVRAWMARSELLLLPTRYEGMPNVILEAMSEGLPVVSTQVEGVAEVLGNRLMDQSVPLDYWESFFELVNTLASDCNLRSELGQANRLRAQSEFNLQRQLEKYEQLYEKILRPTLGADFS